MTAPTPTRSLAENLAAYLGAWRCPNQLHGWHPADIGKSGAWALLISVTFVLAALGKGNPAPGAQPPNRLPPDRRSRLHGVNSLSLDATLPVPALDFGH